MGKIYERGTVTITNNTKDPMTFAKLEVQRGTILSGDDAPTGLIPKDSSGQFKYQSTADLPSGAWGKVYYRFPNGTYAIFEYWTAHTSAWDDSYYHVSFDGLTGQYTHKSTPKTKWEADFFKIVSWEIVISKKVVLPDFEGSGQYVVL